MYFIELVGVNVLHHVPPCIAFRAHMLFTLACSFSVAFSYLFCLLPFPLTFTLTLCLCLLVVVGLIRARRGATGAHHMFEGM